MNIKKLALAVSAIVLLLIVGLVGFYFYNQSKQCKEPVYSVTVADILARDKKAKESEYKEIAARLLAEKWLDGFTSEDTCPKKKLDSADIEDIVINDGTPIATATLKYSITLPQNEALGYGSFWKDGKGIYQEGEWTNRIVYMDIEISNNTYTLKKVYEE